MLIYIHKEKDLFDVEQHFPAQHYFIFDDKPKVLASAKRAWKDKVNTVFVRQGRHAHDPENVRRHPVPDLTLDSIGDLLLPDHCHLFERWQ